jgi:SAM-dependent methyltransferase
VVRRWWSTAASRSSHEVAKELVDVEPTEENRRAFDQLHRLRIGARSARPGIPEGIRGLLPDLDGKHVLHLMCGTGEESAELAGLGALVTGVDVFAEALAVAREAHPEIAFVHADPHELPLQLQRHRLDFVYAGGGVLRYLDDLDPFATAVVHALRPGGEFLLWDTHPALECLDPASLRWLEDYFEGVLLVGPRLGEPQQVRLWRLGEVVNAVIRAGLVVRRLEELPAPSAVRRHDPRVPGEFALIADAPGSLTRAQ